MIADLVFHHKRRDAEFTGKFVDVVGIYHLTAVQPLLQTCRWCQEFGGEGTNWSPTIRRTDRAAQRHARVSSVHVRHGSM
jgi:hypothetical protein